MRRLKDNPYYYMEYIANKINSIKVKKILDYGCANGELLAYLIDRGHKLYGYEVDKSIRFSKYLNKKIKVGYGNPQDKLPYRKNEFDVVVLSHVLEHVGDERKCVSEVSRVLKPGGYLLLASPYRGIFSVADTANLKYRFPDIHRGIYSLLEGKNEYLRQFQLKKQKSMYSDATLGVKSHKHYKEYEIRKLLGDRFEIVEFKKYSLFFPFIHLLNYILQKMLKTNNYVLTKVQRLDSKLFPGELSYNFVVYARKK